MNIEEIKALVEAIQPIVSDVTSAGLWAVCLYIFFQLLMGFIVPVLTSWFGFHVVNKVHDYLKAEKTKSVNNVVKHIYKLEEKIISDELNYRAVDDAFNLAKTRNGRYQSEYMHKEDCEWLLLAVQEKLQRELKGD